MEPPARLDPAGLDPAGLEPAGLDRGPGEQTALIENHFGLWRYRLPGDSFSFKAFKTLELSLKHH